MRQDGLVCILKGTESEALRNTKPINSVSIVLNSKKRRPTALFNHKKTLKLARHAEKSLGQVSVSGNQLKEIRVAAYSKTVQHH